MPIFWDKPTPLSKGEELICERLKTKGKLFVFLRENRHLIFDEQMCAELDAMYHDFPRGKPAIAPSILAMATVLQTYEQKSDIDAVLESVFDKRWQMVLGNLGKEDAPFSQNTLCEFRHRLINHDMDKKLNAKVIEVAKSMGGFSFKKLRVALDSAPLQGAGRVEDTFNLIGHALELLVGTAAFVTRQSPGKIREEAGTKIIGKSSIKAAMDIDWADQQQKENALNVLLEDVKQVTAWLNRQEGYVQEDIGITEGLELLRKLVKQDLEPDPNGGAKIKKGVAKERQISISDNEMRHGRKSASRTINGYKQHVAIDLETELILAACVRPANEPEHAAAEILRPQIEQWGEVEELQVDRGYLASPWTEQLFESGKKVVCKPWTPAKTGKFSKKDFEIDLKQQTVTCPAGNEVEIKGSKGQQSAKFCKTECNACPLKEMCTTSVSGRSINIHELEEMMANLSQYTSTAEGRATARERVKVEHALATICNRKGPRARYCGVRKNEYDLTRTAMITNLHILERMAA